MRIRLASSASVPILPLCCCNRISSPAIMRAALSLRTAQWLKSRARWKAALSRHTSPSLVTVCLSHARKRLTQLHLTGISSHAQVSSSLTAKVIWRTHPAITSMAGRLMKQTRSRQARPICLFLNRFACPILAVRLRQRRTFLSLRTLKRLRQSTLQRAHMT